jgi:hypothetical protein
MTTKMIASWLVLIGLTGNALAQTPPGAASGGGPAEVHPVPPPAEARKLCVQAMNADKGFAAEIVKVADERAAQQRDADTLAAHAGAYAHIQKNERHVIYAYAAMWIVAALFVIFLWRRQQVLKAEIAGLRRDLEAATEEHKSAESRS